MVLQTHPRNFSAIIKAFADLGYKAMIHHEIPPQWKLIVPPSEGVFYLTLDQEILEIVHEGDYIVFLTNKYHILSHELISIYEGIRETLQNQVRMGPTE